MELGRAGEHGEPRENTKWLTAATEHCGDVPLPPRAPADAQSDVGGIISPDWPPQSDERVAIDAPLPATSAVDAAIEIEGPEEVDTDQPTESASQAADELTYTVVPDYTDPFLYARPNSLVITHDPRLEQARDAATAIFDAETIAQLEAAHDPLNLPAIVGEQGEVDIIDPNLGTKLLLQDVADLGRVADAVALPQTAARDLALAVLEGTRSPRLPLDGPDTVRGVAVLSRALVASAENGVVHEAGVASLQRVIAASADREVISEGLTLYDAALRAGFSPQEGIRTVEQFLDNRSYDDISLTAVPYCDMLRTFEGLGADPTAIRALLDGVEQTPADDQPALCRSVRLAVMRAAGCFDVTPDEVLEHLKGGLQRGLALPAMLEEVHAFPREEHETRGTVDRYFTPAEGSLHHSPLPYQSTGTLSEGVEALTELTDADTRRGESVSEGTWFFNPVSDTWYSLGGETTDLGGSNAVHDMLAYDLHLLGETLYNFHIHPNALLSVRNALDAALPSYIDYELIATMLRQASGPTQIRSFVSHRLGVTEYSYPSDPQQLEEVARGWMARVSAVIESFGVGTPAELFTRQGHAVIPEVLRRLNASLPDGFALHYYPHGTDIAAAVQANASPPAGASRATD